MTLTALNIVSIVVTVVLACSLAVAYIRLRIGARDAEGAIEVIELDDLPDAFPLDDQAS